VLSKGWYSPNQSSWPFGQVSSFAQHFRFLESALDSNTHANQAQGGSGSNLEKKTVESQTKSPKEKQRREVLRYERKDGGGQRNLNGVAVAASEIMNHRSEKHIKKAAANVLPSVLSGAARQLHLRNGLPAKGTLRHVRPYGLAAKYAAPQVRARFSKSAHATPNVPST
jgi:hypothetical protein